MANNEQLEMLLRSIEEWNQWRKDNWGVRIDLSEANLSDVHLERADLRGVHLERANLSNANLSHIHLSNANLSNANLRDANLSNANLRDANFSFANLSDADLSHANLSDADFHFADLSRVELRHSRLKNANFRSVDLIDADLSHAYLLRTQVLDTDFEGATLTGACIRDWNTNNKTSFVNVICDYIYLQSDYDFQNHKLIFTDRQPSDPNKTFALGDFSRLFQKLNETADLIFREGIDWHAFSESFQGVQIESENEINIQAIERKRDGSFVVRVEVPKDTNKAEIEQFLQTKYNEKLKQLDEIYRKELQAKDEQIEIYRQQNTNLTDIVKFLGSRPINIENRNITINVDTLQGSGYTETIKGSSYTGQNTKVNPSS